MRRRARRRQPVDAMRILVTGAHGFLARSLLARGGPVVWTACGRGPEPPDSSPYHQVDLLDAAAVERLVSAVQPDWIVNTAALTDVDRCEREPELAQRANVDAVVHLAAAAARAGAGLVQVSTDYVFDGTAGPYSETDAPLPLSVYGRTKLASERVALERVDRAIVVRTLWLYGYHPGVRPNFVTWALDALHRRQPIRVFQDQWGNPTYVDDLARALVALCQAATPGLYHMGGTTFLTRYELVLELARLFALEASHVAPVSTQQAGLAAPRPLRSGLRTEALQELLSTTPQGFAEGLAHMRGQAEFQRDFAHLL